MVVAVAATAAVVVAATAAVVAVAAVLLAALFVYLGVVAEVVAHDLQAC